MRQYMTSNAIVLDNPQLEITFLNTVGGWVLLWLLLSFELVELVKS